MTTNKLRRELEALKARRGNNDCPGCGYPSYRNCEIKVNIRSINDPKPPPPRCSVCGREPAVIRVKGRFG